MLSLAAQPITYPHAIFGPGEHGFLLKVPGIHQLKGRSQKCVSCPEPEDCVIIAVLRYRQYFNLIQAHIRIGIARTVRIILCATGILPWRINYDNVKTAVQRWNGLSV